MIILITGLPGVGKSTVARELKNHLDADVLDRDEIRDQIFPTRDLDYSAEQNELASQVTYQVVEYILDRNPERIIILDGRPFSKRAQVEEVQALARRVDHPLRTLYCWAPDDLVQERLERDLRRKKNYAADRTMEKYYRIKTDYHNLEVDHLSIDTSQPLEIVIEAVLNYLHT